MEHAKATQLAQAVLDTCKRQIAKNRSLDNINLDAVVRRAITGHVDLAVKQGDECSQIEHILMQDIVGDYDTPDTVSEWAWVETHASYQHRANGKDGIWEFVVNLARHFDDIPDTLRPVFEKATQSGVAYLVFHQGT